MARLDRYFGIIRFQVQVLYNARHRLLHVERGLADVAQPDHGKIGHAGEPTTWAFPSTLVA